MPITALLILIALFVSAAKHDARQAAFRRANPGLWPAPTAQHSRRSLHEQEPTTW